MRGDGEVGGDAAAAAAEGSRLGRVAGVNAGSEPAETARTEPKAEGGPNGGARMMGKAGTERKKDSKGKAETGKKAKPKSGAESKGKAKSRGSRRAKDRGTPKGAARARSGRSGEAKVARSGRGASGRRQELNHRVLAELRNLRIQLDQLVERFELRMGGQLNELIGRIEGDPSLGQEPRLLTVRTAEAMLDAVAAGEIRPKKGRPKDFVKLEAVVRELGDLAPDE